MYPTEEETALWIALNLTQRSIFREMEAALRAKGLPPLRWYDILWAIERAGKNGIRAFELEKGLIFQQSSISRMLRRIVNEGLVVETVYENDRRGKVLRTTAKGRKIRKQMWKEYGPMIHLCMSRGPKDADLNCLTSMLTSLRE